VLELEDVETTSANPWGKQQSPSFTVIAHTAISVTIPHDHRGYQGRSHSLWYCDAKQEHRYAWFETAFMAHPLTSQPSPSRDPFALAPGVKAAKAVGPGIAEIQVAWPFTPVTIDDADEFIDRWAGWYRRRRPTIAIAAQLATGIRLVPGAGSSHRDQAHLAVAARGRDHSATRRRVSRPELSRWRYGRSDPVAGGPRMAPRRGSGPARCVNSSCGSMSP
jgi:hypothetical protein